MSDVAQAAGVSVPTVSKVVNGHYGVAPETADRVRRVVAELGFETSLVARSLRSRRTGVIGILVSDFEPFSTEVLKGAAKAVRDSGYELVAYSAGGSGLEQPGWERRYLNRLGGTLIDGAVLVTPSVVDVEPGVAVVAVDPHVGNPNMSTVLADNVTGARSAVDHLLGLGHRRIGFVAGRRDLESAAGREEGYRQALTAAGLPVDEGLIRSGDFLERASADAARGLLAGRDRPTAIFAANDLSAITAMAVARSLGLVVPRDLSVVGFDNVPESAMAVPPLTTIDQHIQAMGRRAVELLLELLEGAASEPRHEMIATSLVVRGTSAAPR